MTLFLQQLLLLSSPGDRLSAWWPEILTTARWSTWLTAATFAVLTLHDACPKIKVTRLVPTLAIVPNKDFITWYR